MDKDRKKRRSYIRQTHQFSDQELAQQMQQEWQKLVQRQELNEIQKVKEIDKIYNQRKKKKKLEQNKDRLEEGKAKLKTKQGNETQVNYERHIDDQQEGEIIEDDKLKFNDKLPTPKQFAPYIEKLLLTRAKLQNLLNLPRFQQIIKGCFIRYHSSKNNEYTISQILCSVESNSKVYRVGRVQTNLLLRLQISANEVQNLSMDMVSNQAQSGNMEISRWLHSVGDKVPSIADLMKKKFELEKGTSSDISTEDINRNIMRNIEKILKKEKEVKEDLGIYLSFLNERDHHIEVELKELEERTNDEDTGGESRRNRWTKEVIERPKITKTREELLEEKKKIHEYLEKLREVKQIQLEKKLERKEMMKTKVEKVYDTRVLRKDKVMLKIEEKIMRLSTKNEKGKVHEEILKFHREADFHIDFKI